MTLTLLLDLDDTLLDSNMDVFIPAYFQALSEHLADSVDPKIMLPALVAGTRKMMANNDPAITLSEVFDSEFFPAIGIDRETMQPLIEHFYKDVFPGLKDLTSPRPSAVSLVEWSLGHGFNIAIATNPLFPQAAIFHRMSWAGLPQSKYNFPVVSSFENFHFTKPNPAYYAEVMAQLGWPEGPVLLVGDDLENDVQGGQNLGLKSFWIADPKELVPDGRVIAGRGHIGDVRDWLKETDLSTLEPVFNDHGALLAILRSTPAAIAGILDGIEEHELYEHPVPDEWSLTEVVCHLRDTEKQINLQRIRTMLEQSDPFLPAYESDTWPIDREYNKQPFSTALAQFIFSRKQTLKILQDISQEQWQRTGRHAIFGPSTLHDIVKFMAEHDRLHIRQIKATSQQVNTK